MNFLYMCGLAFIFSGAEHPTVLRCGRSSISAGKRILYTASVYALDYTHIL